MVNSEWALVNPRDTFPDSRKDLSRHRNSILECTIHLGFSLGSRNIKLADPNTVKDVTGYEIGSIPPFHWQPPRFRSIVDACLMEEEVLGVGAGVWGEEIMITPDDLVGAVGAEVVDLSGTPRSR